MRGRPPHEYPVPRLRQRKKSWRVWWRTGKNQYEIVLGEITQKSASIMRDQVALALKGAGEWPPDVARTPAVRRYLLAKSAGNRQDVEQIIHNYQNHMLGEVSHSWAMQSVATIRELMMVSGMEPQQVTPREAQEYLDHVLATPGPHHKNKGPRTISTRNRCLAVCSRFYKWATKTGRAPINPFAGIKQLKVEQPERITYCTKTERYLILRSARNHKDHLAIWLAMYGGMRLGEIARARWDDVKFSAGRLVVPKSKNRKRRVLPMAKRLERKLKRAYDQLPPKHRCNTITEWPTEERAWKWRAEYLIREISRDLADTVATECVGWTSFRHTFGSLLAQAGVSIDKISAWMGNTPEVCRRHYAEFIPRDGRDEEIDLL